MPQISQNWTNFLEGAVIQSQSRREVVRKLLESIGRRVGKANKNRGIGAPEDNGIGAK
jgi:uncharacterized protein with GYD domain